MTVDDANPPTSSGVVVVGAGLAAAHVLETLRDGGYEGALTLIGNEGERPYERPPLSKDVLLGEKEVDTAYVHDAGWYTERDIDLRLDDAAVSLDREGRRVVLASGDAVPYEDLVLATGASARTLPLPGADLDGVHLLRTIADCTSLLGAYASGTNLVVIGAGWIGLEAAAAARKVGLEVTVLETADVPLKAAMGPQLGAHFGRLHEGHGVDVRTGVSVDAIEGTDGHVSGVRVDGATLPADLVVIGVGASPNTQLAEDAGLPVDNGVLVDQHLRTEDPHVLAVGDVADAFNTTLGVQLRVEHWDNAIRQGKLAAHVLLGEDKSYDWLPYFYTDQFDLGMEYVGHGSADDEVVIRGEEESGEFIAFWLRDGSITAAMNVNVWDVSDELRDLVGRPIAAARLADTSIELGDLGG